MNGLVLRPTIVRHPRLGRVVEVTDGEVTLSFVARKKRCPERLPVVCVEARNRRGEVVEERLPGWQYRTFAEEAMNRFGIEPPRGQYTRGRRRGRR